MKNLLFLFILTCICKTTFAQKELITLDEHNKYIYYHLADMPGINADTLYHRTLVGLKSSKQYKSSKPVVVAGSSITLKSKITLYTSLTVAKHETGDVTYTLVLEFKEGKYRYWLTNFVFAPYERTRYGVYAKAPGGEMTLEAAKSKYDAKIFDTYLDQIAKYGNQFGEEMTFYVATPQKKAPEPAKIDTRKW